MRGARYQRVRGILFLAVGLGTAGLVLALWGFGVLDSLERQSIDARFSIRGDRPAPKGIVFAQKRCLLTNAAQTRRVGAS